MAKIVLFHLVLGLRDAERTLAARWRQAGHQVLLPDLFDGASTNDLDEGFRIKDHVGWDAIRLRAAAALTEVDVQSILLLHGVAGIPATARSGTPIQPHVAAEDPFFPQSDLSAWARQAQAVGLTPELHLYDDAGQGAA